MREFLMLMKASGGTPEDWNNYINTLVASGLFRGGSALGNGLRASKNHENTNCEITGFMRFEAESINEVSALLSGNPVIEAGGEVEISELLKT